MFQSARLKLTTWYLVMIMLISIVFSVAFYHLSTQEIQRVIKRVEFRQEYQQRRESFSPPHLPSIQALQESEQRLLIVLVLLNGTIFFLAGGAGYFLAGRTLKPIKRMMEEQNRFITDASHELRTPVTALRAEMEASLLDKQMTTKAAKNLIASNLEEVITLQALSDNLLQLAQFKHNGKRVFVKVSLAQAIEDAIKKVTRFAQRKHITITNEVDERMLLGNAHDLRELFVILLENAIKYSPDTTTIVLTAQKNDRTIAIKVTDQGIGIAEKDLPHIFDRFYRVEASRTTPGYGLGLSIAKKIVEAHNGSLSVESSVGKGTTFSITFFSFFSES